jgi:hypothetical protein
MSASVTGRFTPATSRHHGYGGDGGPARTVTPAKPRSSAV